MRALPRARVALPVAAIVWAFVCLAALGTAPRELPPRPARTHASPGAPEPTTLPDRVAGWSGGVHPRLSLGSAKAPQSTRSLRVGASAPEETSGPELPAPPRPAPLGPEVDELLVGLQGGEVGVELYARRARDPQRPLAKRARALYDLALLHDARGATRLTRLALDPGEPEELRRQAVAALACAARVRPSPSLPELRRLALEERGPVARSAGQALRALRGRAPR